MSPQVLLRDLGDLAARARALRLQEYETSKVEVLFEHVVEPVASLVDDATHCLSRVLQYYDDLPQGGERESTTNDASAEAEQEEDFLSVVDSMMESTPGSRIADLAFMARLELANRRSRLERLEPNTPIWGILSSANSAKRRVMKAATALERSIREFEGLRSEVDEEFVTELAYSLQIRRTYTKFRKAVCTGEQTTQDDIVRRLRLGAVQLAMLVGRDVYEHLRIMDRMEFRRLQAAIVGWLRSSSEDRRAGVRLWQELTSFAGLLIEVNGRTELMHHDLALIEDITVHLDKGESAFAAAPEVVSGLARPLWGRDDELDVLIERSAGEDFARWIDVTERIGAELRSRFQAGVPSRVMQDVTDVILSLHGKDAHGRV